MVLTPSTTEGQADPVLPAPAHKYEMKPSCHPILASAFNRHYPNTSVMQHSRQWWFDWPQHTSRAGHVRQETETCLAGTSLDQLVWINSSLEWQYRNRNDCGAVSYIQYRMPGSRQTDTKGEQPGPDGELIVLCKQPCWHRPPGNKERRIPAEICRLMVRMCEPLGPIVNSYCCWLQLCPRRFWSICLLCFSPS